MTLESVVVLALVAALAIGAGVSVGWILSERYRRAHPVGIEAVVQRVAAGAAQQVELARRDANAHQRKLEELHAAEVATLRQTVAQLTYAIRQPRVPDGPAAPPPRPLDLADSVARASGEPVSEYAEARDGLLTRGFSGEEADAIIRGELDNVPPDGKLDRLALGMVADRTAVT